jgi:hypothetical protein
MFSAAAIDGRACLIVSVGFGIPASAANRRRGLRQSEDHPAGLPAEPVPGVSAEFLRFASRRPVRFAAAPDSISLDID